MLNKNPNLIYYSDVFSCLSNKKQSELIALVEKSKENCNDRQKKKFLDGIIINKSKFSLEYFDENIYYMLVNFINKRIKETKDKEIINYFQKVVNSNLDNIKINNNRFPFIFLIILIENFISEEELDNFFKNTDFVKKIIETVFIKTITYNIYIDESGNPDNVKDIAFIIGGYYIKNINSIDWKSKIIDKFNDIRNKYKSHFSSDKDLNKIYHRTELKHNNMDIAYSITKDIINFVNKDINIIYIYDEKPNDITNSKYYYITLVSTLLTKLLYKILTNETNVNDTKIILNINIAKRQNLNIYGNEIYINEVEFLNFLETLKKENISGKNILKKYEEKKYKFVGVSQIEDSEIKSGIENSLEQLEIKYGLLNDNIKINITIGNANKDKDLVISDYLCNLFYSSINNSSKNNDKEKELFNLIENKISLKILYSFIDNIDFYFDKKDYYNIIDNYIFNKKISLNSRDKTVIKNAKIYTDKLISYSKNDNHKNKYRYIVLAVKSILEKIEYESNLLKNYNDIIMSYDILVNFIKKISFNDNAKEDNRLKNSVIFVINTDKLAVFNHSEDHKSAYKIIEENNNIMQYALSEILTKDRIILFDILMANAQWHIYDADSCIRFINKNLDNIEELYKNSFTDEIGKLYSTLGQAYIILYYNTDNIEYLEKARENFNKAIKYFDNKKYELIREYSYLQNLSVILKDNDAFIENTEKYLELVNANISNILIENISYFLEKNPIKDKDYEFFLIRILKYCNTFNTDISKHIFNVIINSKKIITNNINSLDSVDILKEYTLLCYRNNKKNINYLYDCHKFMENQTGYFNDMRRLSLYIIEILMDNDSNFNEAIRIIEYLSSVSKGYQQTFSSLLEESKNNNLNKKDWALKVRNKLYM